MLELEEQLLPVGLELYIVQSLHGHSGVISGLRQQRQQCKLALIVKSQGGWRRVMNRI
ncbi:hypothetical protein D3C72_2219220 [compost metagenome]